MNKAAFVEEVASAFAAGENVVLHAPTGAGKSTLLPLHLLQHTDARILLIQPRQVAARAVAQRIASLFGCGLGEEVGYQVRFDRRASAKTRLLVVTDGVALQLIQADPLLEGWDILLLDEFHERSVQLDLVLAFARESQLALRDDLRIAALSATLDVERVEAFLSARVLRTEGRSYPLRIEFPKSSLPTPWSQRDWERSYIRLIERSWEEGSGDVLVFMPGVGEIQRIIDGLTLSAPLRGVPCFALHGSLTAEEQDRALQSSDTRRIIVATNVAETSLTVPGVDTVVDSGWVRRVRIQRSTGMNRLLLERVSQASADQRAGRAGRVRAGVVFRAWSEADHRRLDAEEVAEILRVDGAEACLEVLRWQGRDVANFSWFEAPHAAQLAQADTLFEALGITEQGVLTTMGRDIASLPLHPRLAALLSAAWGGPDVERALALSVLLSETDFPRDFSLGRLGDESDIDAALQALQHGSSVPALRSAKRAWSRLQRRLEREGLRSGKGLPLASALLCAFPDRVGMRRTPNESQALLSSGMGATLARTSTVVRSRFFVALTMDQRSDEPMVSAAIGLSESDFPPEMVHRRVVLRFSEEGERVEAREQRYFGALILDERTTKARDMLEVSRVLAVHAKPRLDEFLQGDEAAARWLDRYRFARTHLPDTFPALDDTVWDALLMTACSGARSFQDLRSLRWLELLRGIVGWGLSQKLDELVPETLEVPSGSRIRLEYREEGPVLAVRLQEMFGCADTPRILEGRVPVVLHLLAPNYRPQQVTEDLAGFWERTYSEVRKELRARYPKHAWPEDPLAALPQRGARRRPR